jgi:tagatose 1,6-diphosphate aldolase
VLELLGYDLRGKQKTQAYARIKPEIVAGSIEEFSKQHYGVDLLKIEIPVDLRFVPGSRFFGGEAAYTRTEAEDHLVGVSSATKKPFVYLSAGVTNAEFVETLEFVAECGGRFNGVLCGRATW